LDSLNKHSQAAHAEVDKQQAHLAIAKVPEGPIRRFCVQIWENVFADSFDEYMW